MENDRQYLITRTAIIGILANLAIASIKVLIGIAASSLAIISEGINNASDAVTSCLTLIGTKLSAKHPDEKHPFGYGRIEYLTGMVIGILILYTGISLIRESINGILHPEPMNVTILAILIIAGSAVAKYALGVYNLHMGEKADSDSLRAIGEDSKNDAFISIVTIISSFVYLWKGFSLDAYAGLVFAVVILKAAYETLKNTSADLIGTPGEEELAKKLYKEIRSTEGILGAADMMLHSYGPDHYSGSVNVEIDHKKNIGEIYEYLHALQLHIMHEYNVTMVFGIYAVDYDSPYIREMREYIVEFVRAHANIKSYHALYLSESTSTLYVDFIVDYELRDWDETRRVFTEYMKEKYPQYKLELTIETDFV